jgi:hypothetical protein
MAVTATSGRTLIWRRPLRRHDARGLFSLPRPNPSIFKMMEVSHHDSADVLIAAASGTPVCSARVPGRRSCNCWGPNRRFSVIAA